jgi:formylglycine-generating enzyme required for sulfatase activity
MSYAHQNGILHKDIKPQNMMVTKDNKVKIMDFGIAETVRTSMSRIQNSTSSGTLVYMSPEQINGKDVGKESDIYSFGVLLYELLNGNPPFYKGALEYQILNEKPEQLSAVSAKMNDLIMKCLEKDYKDRFKDFRKIIEFFGEKIKQYSPISVSKKQTTASASKLKTLTAISIITEPSDAIVYLNGKKFEELTPLNTKYVVGEITIKIEKAGYKTIEDIIEISEGSSNEFYLELESVMGTITIESETEEIPIYLNKKKTEFVTPHTFDNIIPNKEYEICLKLGSRHSEIKSIKIELNKHKKIYFHESEFKFKIPENMVVVKGGKLQRKYHRFFKTIEQIIKVNSYIIGKYLVTQQEYEEIMGNNPSSCKKEKVINKGFLGIDRKIEKITEPKHPVENVSWYDAVEFCNKKSLIEGLTPCYTINKNRKDSNNKSTIDNLKWTVTCNFNANGYRLPTDAEWEYTARGGIKSKGYKYSGSNSIEEVAWSTSNSKQKTHKVGSLQLNELGIYDMSGNVWEWCWNWFDTEYYKKKLQNNQTRPVYGKNRVRRGGSFFSDANNCDIGNFSYSSPHLKFNTVGFRICMTAYSKTEIN